MKSKKHIRVLKKRVLSLCHCLGYIKIRSKKP